MTGCQSRWGKIGCLVTEWRRIQGTAVRRTHHSMKMRSGRSCNGSIRHVQWMAMSQGAY